MLFGSIQSVGRVSVGQSRLLSTYVSSGWSSNAWHTNNNSTLPRVIPGYIESSPFPMDRGPSITDLQSRQQVTYTDWEFEKLWGITEGVSRPYLLNFGFLPVGGPPGTSTRTAVFVADVSDTDELSKGSMFFEGRTYMYIGPLMTDRTVHRDDHDEETITWTYFGDEVQDPLLPGMFYEYFASGIQDPEFAGGYGHYEPDATRTVPFYDERSNNVNFYYKSREAVAYDYLIGVKLPKGMAHIVIVNEVENYHPLKVVTHDAEGNKQYSFVSLVTVDDDTASPIRVETSYGVLALQQLPERDYNLKQLWYNEEEGS